VDITATPGSNLLPRLSALGLDVESMAADGSSVRAHVNVADLETIAADPNVVFIQPRQGAVISRVIGPESRPLVRRAAALRAFLSGAMGQEALPNVAQPTGQGSRSSEGDVTHLAFAARGAFHIDGTGVKIGVLSDGVTNLAASQARGDLGPVTVLPGQTGSGDEGTAMLEIVHDLAPRRSCSSPPRSPASRASPRTSATFGRVDLRYRDHATQRAIVSGSRRLCVGGNRTARALHHRRRLPRVPPPPTSR
jgi:hypothetical protein